MRDYSRLTKAELIERIKELQTGSGGGVPEGGAAVSKIQTEAALHDTEERMRAILQTAVEGIITIDERGTIESINPAAERIFGYGAAEVTGQNVKVLMPAPYREEHDKYLSNYVETGQAKVIGIGREVVGRRKDGTTFPMDLAVSEVRLADRRLFTGFVRDITERKRGELRQRVQYATVAILAEASSLSEAAPQLMRAIGEIKGWSGGEFWSVDSEADVVHYVQSWSRDAGDSVELTYLGESGCCKRGENLPGRVWANSKPEWVAHLTQDMKGTRLAPDLSAQLAGALAFPILVGNAVLGVMIFFTDQTNRSGEESLELYATVGRQIGQFIERKRAEAKLAELARTLAEKNKELETIVYVASHDLRSPLVNIQGFSSELARACETVRTRLADSQGDALSAAEVQTLLAQDIPEALEFILAGVKKIDALLAGFLRFSRLGRAAIKSERVHMNELLASIAQTMDFQLKQAGVKLQIEKLPDCQGDATQLNQVFSNLLDNALKYLDPRRLGQFVVRGNVENGRATYCVRDNGIGIAPEHQAKIFEIFHRLNPSRGEGEGLGLTIAQKILERQGGQIWVESVPGEGSTFFVSLPA